MSELATFIDPSDIPAEERIEIRYLPLEDICTDYNNPNGMTEEDFLSLVESIEVLGFVQPCVVVPSENTDVATDLPFVMVDGLHRWRALAKLDRTACPVIVATNLDHAHAIIARIALNKNRGQLNLTTVAAELHSLSEAGLTIDDLCVTGYTEAEIAKMLDAMTSSVDEDIGAQFGATSVLNDDVDTGAPRPFILEVQFPNKDMRNRVRKALKDAGSGDVMRGLLAVTDIEED